MNEITRHFENTKQKLNTTGCGMCLAKWTQTTIHLQLGRTHSCHHPDTHVIPLSELKRNPSALHNTKYKKELRREMLQGLRPTECDYCWKVEDNSNEFSDRTFKSAEEWALPHFDEIIYLESIKDPNVKYFEPIKTGGSNYLWSIKNFSDFYDRETAEIVYEKHKNYFEVFNYDFYSYLEFYDPIEKVHALHGKQTNIFHV